MHLAHIKKFVMDMELTDEENAKYNKFIIYGSGREMFMDTPEGRQLFEDLLRQIKPRVVFIDSLNKIVKKSISDDDAMRVLMTYLQAIIQEYNLCIIVLHHDRKRQQGQSTTELDDVYGSRFLTSEADFVMTLAKTSERNVLELHYPKSRFGNTPAPVTLRRTNKLDYVIVEETKVGVKHANLRDEPPGESSPDDSEEPTSDLFIE